MLPSGLLRLGGAIGDEKLQQLGSGFGRVWGYRATGRLEQHRLLQHRHWLLHMHGFTSGGRSLQVQVVFIGPGVDLLSLSVYNVAVSNTCFRDHPGRIHPGFGRCCSEAHGFAAINTERMYCRENEEKVIGVLEICMPLFKLRSRCT